MSRIVLHIGLHKTGTTSLQAFCAEHRNALRSAGVCYPDLGTDAQHALLAEQMPWLERFRYGPSERDAWDFALAAYRSTGAHTLLLSSEEFSRADPVSVDMAQLAAQLNDQLAAAQPTQHAAPPRVSLLCTLREQIGLIESLYGQDARWDAPPSLAEVYDQALSSNRVSGIFLDFGALRQHLLSGFAPHQLHFLSYRQASAQPGGLIGTFLRLLSQPPAPLAAATPSKPVTEPLTETLSAPLANFSARNVSPSPVALWAAHELTRPDKASKALVARAQQLLKRHLRGQRIGLFTPSERERLSQHFNALNRRFLAQLPSTAPAPNLALPSAQEYGLCRSDLDRAFWVQLARGG
ncbi:hypothetical protein U5801_24380 [Lamprobacter modestohalophilus]|uniref:hypothetical protein n=1 Tax=Lamprobacter modestohalophilus TaxID=1064514 RepID=UPI002ADEFA4D|nr:hypothetical protein [Lamprobacter modestohalophilus]MEA1052920.1 hypothetical protein [Lamprobacter modestohalophilus]